MSYLNDFDDGEDKVVPKFSGDGTVENGDQTFEDVRVRVESFVVVFSDQV